MQRKNCFSNKFTLSSICGEKIIWIFFLSVKVNTSESLRTWLLSYSFNCGTQTREFYIMELTEFGSILLMCTCIIYTFGTEFLLKQIKYLF